MDNLISTISEQGVLLLRLNRLDKKNALTGTMYQALCQQFDNAEQNSSIKCIVIIGSDQCFTAGNDLHDFLAANREQELPAVSFIHRLKNCTKPLLAATSGPAVGIGTTLLLHCDYVCSTNSTLFKLPFTQLGLCPEAGSSMLLPRRIGHNKAFEYLVLGKSFDAATALNLGLINHIVEPSELESHILSTASIIASLPAKAVSASKMLMKTQQKADLDSVIENELEMFSQLLNSPECKNIISEFFRK